MKKIILLFLFIFSIPFLFADEITDLLDKAKMEYSKNDTESFIETLDLIKNKIKQEKNKNSTSSETEVSFNRLKVTPEKYLNKALKIKAVAIDSSGFKKMEYYDKPGEYGVVVRNIIMNDSFWADIDEGKMVFVMDENLVDKLLDEIPPGYSYYYNIWTEPVYKHSYYLTQYSPERICYIAKIIKLEAVEYNKYTEVIIDTGEFIEN